MRVDITNVRFTRLVAIERVGRNKHRESLWKCKCDCGEEKVVRLKSLRNGDTKSCGCLLSEFASKNLKKNRRDTRTHSFSNHPLYMSWYDMKRRCYDRKNTQYHNYGARGITVANEWLEISGFISDMEESYLDHVNKHGKDNTTLDRIDVDKGYCKDNCRWSTQKLQATNRRTNKTAVYKGNTLCMSELSEFSPVGAGTIYKRIKGGWDVEKAVETPNTRKRGTLV